MLYEFRTENFKSFRQEAVFSMSKAQKQKGLDYSLLYEKCAKKNYIGLSSSVIYGPNASGKTNIIGAMDVLRSIILRGNIRNNEEDSSPNKAAFSLEFIPNNLSITNTPVTFGIKFIEADCFIEYELKLDLGRFLQSDYERKIISEKLTINGSLVFNRTKNVEIGNLNSIKRFAPYANGLRADYAQDILDNSLNPEELFLTNGFRLLFSQKLVKIITDWFAQKFMVVYRSDSIQLIRRFSDPKNKTIYIDKTTNQAAQIFGISSNSLGYVSNKEDGATLLFSMLDKPKYKKGLAILAEIFESYGTIRFVNMFPLVLKAVLTGGTLVVDEFDASIHPMALMNIINIFHNDEINIHHAQLIFNTHNPIFLNSNLLRRDEIKFVERDATDGSIIYSLSDFGTSGSNGVRRHEDYMKNYFISRYGAIKDIDFTSIFEELITSLSKEE